MPSVHIFLGQTVGIKPILKGKPMCYWQATDCELGSSHSIDYSVDCINHGKHSFLTPYTLLPLTFLWNIYTSPI